MSSQFLTAYRAHVAERAALGIPPLPLSAKQTGEMIELLKSPPQGEEAFLVDLITYRVPAGVDDAAKVKASYLAAVAHGTEQCTLISREKATELLGTMLGGYNISPMVDLLDDSAVAQAAANGLKNDTYTVAMARTSDPHSASAQFFINVNNNDMLNYPGRDGWGYAVFGKVVSGMEVVDKIKLVEVANGSGGHANVPVTPVVIQSATLLN